jgi:uroporphyrin-3 C-methyltransferase
VTESPDPTGPRRRGGAWLLVPVLVVALAAGLGWREWKAREAAEHAEASEAQRLDALELRVAALRRDQRAQAQRLQHADATNRLLREELLGLGQRAALLEETVNRLADGGGSGAQALRLDEVELLLSQGAQRLALFGDVAGARRTYALAAGLMDGVDDPDWIDVRQSLAQERAALDALGEDPRADLAARMDAFAAALEALPQREDAVESGEPHWWRRLLGRVVQVRPSNGAPLASDDRQAGLAALRLELAVARAALASGDATRFDGALARIGDWIPRLWPESRSRAGAIAELAALRAASVRPEIPELGTTLAQLQRLRAR